MNNNPIEVAARDRGQILILVVAFIAFAGLVSTSILTLTGTGLAATSRLKHIRDERYSAAAVLDTHIEYLSRHPELAATAGSCPTSTATINAIKVTVSCTNTGATTIGRDLVLVAAIGARQIVTADVFIDAGSNPDVFVNAWAYG